MCVCLAMQIVRSLCSFFCFVFFCRCHCRCLRSLCFIHTKLHCHASPTPLYHSLSLSPTLSLHFWALLVIEIRRRSE